MSLSLFERTIILELLSGDPDEALLLQQLEQCSVTGRDVSGHGIFVNLLVNDEVPRLDRPRDLPIEGARPSLTHPDVEHRAAAVLWLKDGALSALEMFTYAGEEWPTYDTLFVVENLTLRH